MMFRSVVCLTRANFSSIKQNSTNLQDKALEKECSPVGSSTGLSQSWIWGSETFEELTLVVSFFEPGKKRGGIYKREK